MDQNIVFYKCNNIFHKECGCIHVKEDGPIIRKEEPTTIWEKKKNSTKEDCGLAFLAEDKEDKLYIDNGCSKHMIRDRHIFININK